MKARATGGVLACLALLAGLATGCARRAPLWEDRPRLTNDVVEAILRVAPGSVFDRDLLAGEVAVVPVRQRVRPCCVFGHDVNARVGPVPVPGYRIQNVIGVDDLGPHRFDAGLLTVGSDDGELFEREANGLVYTCRGGFIDTAHLRDYADWMVFVTAALARELESGATIPLPREGGARSIVLEAVPVEIVTAYGRRRLAVSMAEWIVYQMSIWHEIATWYGWSALPPFPERASAFSPEDLYSNALGILLAAGVIAVRAASDDTMFNDTMDRWTRTALRKLGALDRDAGVQVADLVDGLWWDSSRRVPDARLLLRRNFDISRVVRPWTVELSGRLSSEDRAKPCAPGEERVPLPIPDALGDVAFADFVSLRIQPDPELAARLPTRNVEISQADFDAVVASIRAAALVEFGPRADSPD
jgi:hypothetical protein